MTDLINAGVYVLEPSVLDHVPAGQPSSFERNLFPSLLASGAPTYGYELHGYWRDLGTRPDRLSGRPVRPARGACTCPSTPPSAAAASGSPTNPIDEGPYSAAPSWSARARSWRTRAACSDRPCSAPARWWPAAPAWSGRCCWRGRGSTRGQGVGLDHRPRRGRGRRRRGPRRRRGRRRRRDRGRQHPGRQGQGGPERPPRPGRSASRRRSAPGPATWRRRGPCSRSRTPGRRRC